MRKKIELRPVFSIENPNKGWVVKELDRLKREWSAWLEVAAAWGDSPDYNPQTCTEPIKDGRDNRRKHAILRKKTMVFVGNNFSGYHFLFDDWPSHPHEDNTSRLRKVISGMDPSPRYTEFLRRVRPGSGWLLEIEGQAVS